MLKGYDDDNDNNDRQRTNVLSLIEPSAQLTLIFQDFARIALFKNK